MGNVIESFASGIGNVIGKIFGSPIDFLSGKSCSSTCGPTWDLMCYIEHFCIANVLKLALIFVLVYIDLYGHACLVGSTCGSEFALSCVSSYVISKEKDSPKGKGIAIQVNKITRK
ncbi:uncharacterized protein LOC129303854 isoform X2 [Prosopis cineraria]|uniref:uncharacterized protein LOC129303854 isoform X2 n=1 Tax=Prosopis cineraria TaxID=364024 RepID=UPI00240EABBC|nr:uncharacterized protein LOC129303854 isoform X2 [Prosopis cineraria]